MNLTAEARKKLELVKKEDEKRTRQLLAEINMYREVLFLPTWHFDSTAMAEGWTSIIDSDGNTVHVGMPLSGLSVFLAGAEAMMK